MSHPANTPPANHNSYHDEPAFSGLPSVDFREVLSLYMRKWWVILLTVAFASLAASYYLYQQPKLYESQAVIFVGQEKERVVDIQSVSTDEFRDLAELKTVEQSLASGTVILRVAKACGLVDDPTFVVRKNPEVPPTDAKIIATLGGRVTADLRRGTRLIDLKVRDTDPERAKRLAQAFVEEFTDMNYEQQLAATTRAKMALGDEADRLAEQVGESERRLQAYRESNPNLPLDEEGNLVVDELKALNRKLNEAKAEKLRLQTQVEKLETIDESADADAILQIGTVAQLSEISDLTKLINQREAEFAKIQKRYMYKHPTYISTQSELEDLRASMGKAAKNAAKNIRKRHEAAVENELKLVKAIEAQSVLALKMDEVLIDYSKLAREVASDRDLHLSVIKRLKETDLTGSLKAGHLRLMVAPMVSESLVWPRKKLTLAVAVILGCAFGAGLILLLNWYEGTLLTSPQLERALGVPALANVPEGGFTNGNSLVLRTDPQSPVAESFRMLRSSLSFIENGDSLQSVLFTSSTPDEGKSFSAANYALALASQGYRTLLIDADLRRPTIGGLFYGDEDAPGLSDYLNGEAEASAICRRSGTDNLFVITAGSSRPNPAELLGNQRVINLVRESYRWFDRVIIDTSPLGLVSDALPLARCMESVCLVVRSGKTPQREVVRTSRYLEMAGVPLTGFVLNRVRQTTTAKSYYYHHPEESPVANDPAVQSEPRNPGQLS
jgi:capsular exopolysaccharide synthesis family protein